MSIPQRYTRARQSHGATATVGKSATATADMPATPEDKRPTPFQFRIDGIDDLVALPREELIRRIDELLREKGVVTERARKAEEARRREAEERARREREEREAHDAHIAELTSMDLPLDWENAFLGDSRTDGVHAASPADGLILSLANLGKVDIEYIAAITDTDCKTVIETLRGSIYQNPVTWNECFYKGWETAEEYLSGRLMSKWKAAKEATKAYNGYFDDNVRAIENALPPAVATDDIYVTLGSPWVPTDVIDEFLEHLLGMPRAFGYWRRDGEWVDYGRIEDGELTAFREIYSVKHDEITGSWEIPEKNRYRHSFAVTTQYGTDRIEALHIIEKTLNQRVVAVYDEVSCPSNASGKKRQINKADTLLAQEKQKAIIEEFQKWVWTDPERSERLQIVFEDRFSCMRQRRFDGRFLTFPTMSESAHLYPYQKDAVARILFTPNTLLAHEVGSGKTYVMVAAGMEKRRMGLSKKNLYVVPNNIVGQWRDVFLELYPNANLLIVEPRTFVPKRRKAVLEAIRDNDYDGIIMAYSCFEQIHLSKSFHKELLEDKRAAVSKAAQTRVTNTSQLQRRKKAIQKALDELSQAMDELYDSVYFDELGIEGMSLFVDEAHNFKNVPLQTKLKNVLGISAQGSKRCQDMLDKVRLVQRHNNGGGVVMASGTPITNSITEAFVLELYLQSGELAMLGLQSFDDWVGMFAEQETQFEVDVDTSGFRMATRFSKFHNLPELTSLLASIADFHLVDETSDIPQINGRTDCLIGQTADFKRFIDDISKRADLVRNGRVNRKDDNMLKITSDGRAAALDMRLVDPAQPFTYQSKVYRCAENVLDIYRKTTDSRSTQLVFCDTSTPKDGFNLYNELKDLLVAMGIPPEEIAFVHDAKSDRERSKLFAAVRAGTVRVLIGSTFLLGLGVNVQHRCIALHHLDIPWRPSDMRQREGRILRKYNMHPKVKIFRYIMEGSFDSYMYQLLETKQHFISALLSGSLAERSGSDVDDTALDYAEVKALAVGNPLVKLRVETANELARLRSLERKTAEKRRQMNQELLELPSRIAHQKTLVANVADDIAFLKTTNGSKDDADSYAEKKRRSEIRQAIGEGIRSNELQDAERVLLSYRGFLVVLPARMLREKPFVWIERTGRYQVELGDSESGYLIRIDNCLGGLNKLKLEYEKSLQGLSEREQAIKAELAKDVSYADEIGLRRRELEKIDEKLGVEKQ